MPDRCTICWQDKKRGKPHECPPLMTAAEIGAEAADLFLKHGPTFLNKSLAGDALRWRLLTAPNAVGYARRLASA